MYMYKSQSNIPNRLQLYKTSFLIDYISICKVDICYNNCIGVGPMHQKKDFKRKRSFIRRKRNYFRFAKLTGMTRSEFLLVIFLNIKLFEYLDRILKQGCPILYVIALLLP